MIVDCHTQIWDAAAPALYAGLSESASLRADETRHLAAADPVDKAIVLAFKSTYLGSEISNRFVSEYVRRNPAKMIGFAGIDPTDRDWLEELRIAQYDLHLKGVAISPALQDYHPSDTRAMRLYEECAKRGLPVLFEQNHRNPAAKLEYAQPMLIDAVAREFPALRIVVARLGYPWVHQAVVLLAKHPSVYANVAGLLPHPWLSYSALLAAYEHGVMSKLLFGSDFPFRSPAACIEALYSVNQFSHAGTLPPIPREQLRGIVERDALALLGIGASSPSVPAPSTIFADED
jgi:hypothetical protein